MRNVSALTAGLLCAIAALAACSAGGGSKSGSGKNAEFTSLYDKSKTATLRVTYSTINEDGDEGDTWAISQAGQGKLAYIDKDSKIVTVNGTTTSCENVTDSPRCETLPGGLGNGASAFTGVYAARRRRGSRRPQPTAGSGRRARRRSRAAARNARR